MKTVTSHFDLDVFMQHLAETIAWCNYRAGQHASHKLLRTTLPLPGASILYHDDYQRDAHFQAVFAARRKIIAAKQIPLPSPEVIRQNPGRLLIGHPDQTRVFDNAPWKASRGFFDVDEYTPCGTWVYNLHSYRPEWKPGWEIISWVPSQFIRRVQAGIDATHDRTIFWLTELEHVTSYSQALEQAGWGR